MNVTNMLLPDAGIYP